MGYLGREIQYGSFAKQTLTANSSTTVFTLSNGVADANNLLVSIGGIIQEPNVAYTAIGTVLTFASAPVTNDPIFITYLGMETTTAASGRDDVTYQIGTGNGTTTPITLSMSVVNSDAIRVSLNGVVQKPWTDFTASGTTLTFTTAHDATNEILVYYIGKEDSISDVATGSVTAAKLTASGTLPAWNGSAITNIDVLPYSKFNDLKTSLSLIGFRRSQHHGTSNLDLPNGFIDQFEDETNVDTDASVNETYAMAVGHSKTMTRSSGGWAAGGAYTIRNLIPSSQIETSGSRITVTVQSGSSIGEYVAVYIGHASVGGNAWDFDGNQKQVFFSGSASVEAPAGQKSVVSDKLDFDLDSTKDLIVAFQTSADANKDDYTDSVGQADHVGKGYSYYYIQTTGTVGDTAPSSYFTTAAHNVGIIGIGVEGKYYIPSAASFLPMTSFGGGGNNDLKISNASLGITDGKELTVAFWVKEPASEQSNERYVFGSINGAEGNNIGFPSGNLGNAQPGFYLRDQSNNAVCHIRATNNVPADTATHVVMSVNSATSSIHIAINGVLETTLITSTALSANAIFNLAVGGTTPFRIGSKGTTNSEYGAGQYGQMFYDTKYYDLTNSSTLAKFYSGGPVDMGADGTGTGLTQPLVYLNNAFGTFQNNGGSGGNFTEGGTLTAGDDIVLSRNNMTIISESETAATAPEKAYVTLFNQPVNSVTLNTDIMAWVSRSNKTITATNASNVLNATAHGLSNGDRVMLSTTESSFPTTKFDGTDFITINEGTLGATDGQEYILSMMVKFNADGTSTSIVDNTGSRFYVNRSAGNLIRVMGRDASGNNVYDVTTTSAILAADGFVHLLIGIDLTDATQGDRVRILKDGVLQSVTIGTAATQTNIDMTRAAFTIGADSGTSSGHTGMDITHFYLAQEAMDFSVAGNIAKFYKESYPINLGTTGSTPTGNQPLIYLNNAFGTFQTNLGSGGNFTEGGTLSLGNSYPKLNLPSQLNRGTAYHVVNKTANTFQVAATNGGAAVTFSDDGTGTHSARSVTSIPLADKGDYGTGKAILAGNADISGQPTGTDVRLIVQTKNSKSTKLHGMAVQYGKKD